MRATTTLRPVLIMGPTASGKTSLSLKIAEAIDCEIISVDSAMVYREMNIGTSKPDTAILQNVPHHLIDIIDPPDSYSAGDFVSQAEQLIDQIQQRGKTPLLVGGTGLYFRSLVYGIDDLPQADPILRAEIDAEARQFGWQYMHQKLQQVDPLSASRIHVNDVQRIQRALEVFFTCRKPLSSLQRQNTTPMLEKWQKIQNHYFSIILLPNDRNWLHHQIEQRFLQMLEDGLIAEVENLLQKWNLSKDSPAMRCIGYRQIRKYVTGGCKYDEMLQKSIVATRQLAKRQFTWLRKEFAHYRLDNRSWGEKNVIQLVELLKNQGTD